MDDSTSDVERPLNDEHAAWYRVGREGGQIVGGELSYKRFSYAPFIYRSTAVASKVVVSVLLLSKSPRPLLQGEQARRETIRVSSAVIPFQPRVCVFVGVGRWRSTVVVFVSVQV